jgi:hypothetical protein
VVQNGAQINVDGRLLAVAGNSVGGNMAAAVSLMAKAKGARAPREQLLFWPVATANFETASYDELELYLSSYSGVDMTLLAAEFCFPPPDGRAPNKPSATEVRSQRRCWRTSDSTAGIASAPGLDLDHLDPAPRTGSRASRSTASRMAASRRRT